MWPGTLPPSTNLSRWPGIACPALEQAADLALGLTDHGGDHRPQELDADLGAPSLGLDVAGLAQANGQRLDFMGGIVAALLVLGDLDGEGGIGRLVVDGHNADGDPVVRVSGEPASPVDGGQAVSKVGALALRHALEELLEECLPLLDVGQGDQATGSPAMGAGQEVVGLVDGDRFDEPEGANRLGQAENVQGV